MPSKPGSGLPSRLMTNQQQTSGEHCAVTSLGFRALLTFWMLRECKQKLDKVYRELANRWWFRTLRVPSGSDRQRAYPGT